MTSHQVQATAADGVNLVVVASADTQRRRALQAVLTLCAEADDQGVVLFPEDVRAAIQGAYQAASA